MFVLSHSISDDELVSQGGDMILLLSISQGGDMILLLSSETSVTNENLCLTNSIAEAQELIADQCICKDLIHISFNFSSGRSKYEFFGLHNSSVSFCSKNSLSPWTVVDLRINLPNKPLKKSSWKLFAFVT